MQLTTLVALASFVSTAMAHTHVWAVWVNGVDQGDGRNRYVSLLTLDNSQNLTIMSP